MQDSTSTNNVAKRTLPVVYPHTFDVACFSHTLDYFNPILLDSLIPGLLKLLWKEKTGKAVGSYSASRLWSKWEVMLQVCQYFEM